MHIIDCAKIGSDVVTAPLSSIVGLLNHPLTDSGLKKFLDDHKKAINLIPHWFSLLLFYK